MCPFDKQHLTQKEKDAEWKITELPRVDNGYYDTLAAIGFGALADSYYHTPNTPLIKWTPRGYQIHYVHEIRRTPDLHWLKYSLAASWKSSLDDGVTKMAKGWNKETRIKHNNIVVDTSDKPTIQVEIDGRKREMITPYRTLYGVINKLGKPDWVNLCVCACRERGIEILEDDFEEKSITLNSIVFPQSSKGANSKSSYSIGNSSMPKSFSRPLSRLTCLAVAGLCYAAIGENPTGFAVPMPLDMRVEALGELVLANRKRYYYGGFFFPYNNYLRMVRLLLKNPADIEAKIDGLQKLKGVVGINFIELGNSASPAGTWKLRTPSHKCDIESVEKLQKLLINWRREKKPSSGGDPSIDRKAVQILMNGFESSNLESAVEGYLLYINAVGLKDNYNLLNQTFFEEIMTNSNKYQNLLEEFKTKEVQKFITLIRNETYNKVFKGKDKKSETPNYQMMRKLREVQNAEDLINALSQISVERGINKMASQMTEKNEMETMLMPYDGSIEKIIKLTENYSSKTISHLLLALALSKK